MLLSEPPINFIETQWHYLSPFSAHRIEIWDEVFPTAEHAYQAARVKPGPEHDEIKNAKSPLEAWRLGQKYYKETPALAVQDFDKLAIMEEIFRAKLELHDEIKQVLLDSGDRGLLKVYTTDYFWGTGHDSSGENHMGKLWMKLRDELHK